jgi:hypothetical protein
MQKIEHAASKGTVWRSASGKYILEIYTWKNTIN